MKKLKSFVMSLMITNNFLRITSATLIIATYLLALGLQSMPSHTFAANHSIVKPDVQISANIGEGRLEIFGYGPPHATIVLEGRSMYEETLSNMNGYFVFTNARIRIAEQEICLRALTNGSASSHPICLSIPAQKYVKVGPIILPPIITTNKLNFSTQDTSIIQGSTTPDSDVKIKFFSIDTNESYTTGISLPDITTKSNKDGSFSLSIPDNTNQRLRFYAQTTVDGYNSGQSTILTVDFLPYWLTVLGVLAGLLSGLKGLLPGLIIIFEVAFIVWFFLVRKKKKHELMIVENQLAIMEDHPIQSKASGPR